MTLVPLSIYFNGRGRAKVELALGKGRKHQDKREYGGCEDQGGHPHQIGFVHRRYFPVTSFTKYISGRNRRIAASARKRT